MRNLSEGPLEITIQEIGDKVMMTWEGESNNFNPEPILVPYFKEFVDTLGDKELEIDFTALNYMRSSTVPPLIQLIIKLNARKIKTTIRYARDSNWQHASFKALQSVVNTMECITIIGEDVGNQ